MQREPFAVGDRVKKRGMPSLGTVARISDWGWARIAWDEGSKPRERPRLCLFRELERITPPEEK